MNEMNLESEGGTFSLKPWIMAFRPKTLTAAVIPVLVGISLGAAVTESAARWDLAFFAIFSSICIQIATNLINDAIDFNKGADSEKRLGPVRVSASGLISPRKVWAGGLVFFCLATFFAVPLIFVGGWPILLIGLLSIAAGYIYTGGPFPLAYNGLGDLFVVLFFGAVAVGGSFYLQTGFIGLDALVAGLQVGFLATTLIAVNNLRDVDEDSKNSKNTLAVRFGESFVRGEIVFLNVMSFALQIYWIRQDYSFWWAPLLLFPIVVKLIMDIFSHQPGRIYNRFLARAALLHLCFGAILVFMFVQNHTFRALETGIR